MRPEVLFAVALPLVVCVVFCLWMLFRIRTLLAAQARVPVLDHEALSTWWRAFAAASNPEARIAIGSSSGVRGVSIIRSGSSVRREGSHHFPAESVEIDERAWNRALDWVREPGPFVILVAYNFPAPPPTGPPTP